MINLYYIVASLLVVVAVLISVYFLYFVPKTEIEIDKTIQLYEQEKNRADEMSEYRRLYDIEKAKRLAREDEMFLGGYIKKKLVDKNDNCIELNGNSLNLAECKKKDMLNQIFSYLPDSSQLSPYGDTRCLSEKGNKVSVEDCNGSNSQKWEYTPYPLYRYKNKESKRCMISTGSQITTGMCREDSRSQQFKMRYP